jgi:hypothetical protein
VNQGTGTVSIGYGAGQTGQGGSAVAIGYQAGQANQGQFSIAIGHLAGPTGQPANSIILNASGNALTATTGSAFFVSPVRTIAGLVAPTGTYKAVFYDTASGEFVYGV